MSAIQTWMKNKILRTVSEEIVDFKEARKIEKLIKKTLEEKKDIWVWLAAPQIWINKRVFACKFDKKNVTIVVNPKILNFSPDSRLDQEGCLSLPWAWWYVARPIDITVEFYSSRWEKRLLKLSDFPSRVFQHEFDHLDGILFADKLDGDLTIEDEQLAEELDLI